MPFVKAPEKGAFLCAVTGCKRGNIGRPPIHAAAAFAAEPFAAELFNAGLFAAGPFAAGPFAAGPFAAEPFNAGLFAAALVPRHGCFNGPLAGVYLLQPPG